VTAPSKTTSSRRWWRDQVARLIITIIGAVTAALILAFVIPSLTNSDSSTDNPDTQTEQPAESEETPTESEEPAPAEGG
jgi:hypothetical protein